MYMIFCLFLFFYFIHLLFFSIEVSLSSHFILMSVIMLCICYCNVLPFLKIENKIRI